MKRFLALVFVFCLLVAVRAGVGDEAELMQQGAKGEAVTRVQMRLSDLGFYTYKPTGSFQTVTKSAVVAYQAASGIMSDGSIGEETLRALFSRGAKRAEFHAEIPLTYTAQGAIAQKGDPVSWDVVKTKLTAGESYTLSNAATGESVTLVFESGEGHAELTLPIGIAARGSAVSTLARWLGSTNSFYKCAVLFELDGQRIAASMQWDGQDRVCVYFKDSVSHVLSLPDAEHAANIKKVSY